MAKTLKVFIALFIASMPLACTKHTITGMYIAQSSNEVDVLDIAEAPAGHLSGSLTISTIDKDGSRNKDVDLNITGNLYHDSVSLQISDTGIFAKSMNAVGTYSGNELNLSIAGSQQLFEKTTSRKYAAALAVLNDVGSRQQKMNETMKSIKDYGIYLTSLDSDLQNFVNWANLRIQHEHSARMWYANRSLSYQKCVDTVKPLALRHVPSWKWQSCVISISNDNYNRQQVGDQINQVQSEAAKQEQTLDAKIANIQNGIISNESTWIQSCQQTSSKNKCKAAVQEFKNVLSSSSLDSHIEAYKAILSPLSVAIGEEMQAKTDGEARLSALDNEANDILRSAR